MWWETRVLGAIRQAGCTSASSSALLHVDALAVFVSTGMERRGHGQVRNDARAILLQHSYQIGRTWQRVRCSLVFVVSESLVVTEYITTCRGESVSGAAEAQHSVGERLASALRDGRIARQALYPYQPGE